MIRLNRIATVIALAVAVPACKSESERKADKAAENVIDKQKSLDSTVGMSADKAREAEQRAADLQAAKERFEVRKDIRLFGLRTELAMLSAQPMMIQALADGLPVADTARSDIAAKITTFQTKLDSATNRVHDIEDATADEWKARDDAANSAVKDLADARDAAWNALTLAKRTTPRSS